MRALSRRRSNVPDVWPGFVDALATLVMVVVFVLMVFTIFQFYLKDVISGRDEALNRLNAELGQINALLTNERSASSALRSQLATANTVAGEASRALTEANDARTRLRAVSTLAAVTVDASSESRIAASADSRISAAQSAAEKPSSAAPSSSRSTDSPSGTALEDARRIAARASPSGGGT